MAQNRAEGLRTLAQLIADGAMTPVIDRTFPLGEAAEAIDRLRQGRARGKVVITVGQDRTGGAG